MMSGHGANPICFNKENIDWMSRTLANPPPAKSDNVSFLPYLKPPHIHTPIPPPLKVDIISVSTLNRAAELHFWEKEIIDVVM